MAAQRSGTKSRPGWRLRPQRRLHALLGGQVCRTRRVWLADRTGGHAPAAHNGRSASARTVPPSTTRRDWYRRAHVGSTSGTRGHNGRSAPAGTHQPGTTGRSWYRRARANHRHNGLWLARRMACGVVKVTAEAGHRLVNPGQLDGRGRPTWASAAPLAASIGRGVRRHATAMENTPRLGAAPAASPAGHVGLRAEHPNERCSWPQHAILRRAIDTHMCAAISLRAGSHHLPARTRFTHLRGDPVRASVRRILRRAIDSPTWAAIPLRAGVRILRRRRDGRPTGDPVQSDRRLSASGCGSGMGHAIISWCLRKRASRPNDQVQQPRPLKRP